MESGLYYIVVSRGKKQKEDRSSQQSSSSSLEKISFLYSSLHAKAIVSQVAAAAFAPPAEALGRCSGSRGSHGMTAALRRRGYRSRRSMPPCHLEAWRSLMEEGRLLPPPHSAATPALLLATAVCLYCVHFLGRRHIGSSWGLICLSSPAQTNSERTTERTVHSRSLIYASYSCKQLLPAISASRSVTAAASLPICLATRRRRRAKLPALLPQQCARVWRGARRGAGVALI